MLRSLVAVIGTPARLGMVAILLVAALIATGCISNERLQQIETMAAQAADRLDRGEEAVDQARGALAKAEDLAGRVDSEEATAAVAAAQRALAQAEEMLPALRSAAADTARTLAAAREAREAGGSWIEILLAGGAALATGGTAGAALAGTRAGKLAHALRSTIQYVDKIKPAVDASMGVKERKRLAEETLDREDIKLIEEERARLKTEQLAA